MNVSVVGLGLIGGSLARDLRAQINVNVYGVDSNEGSATMSSASSADDIGLDNDLDMF